jgi:ABC-2 type transport system ATP-binding protein
MHDVMIEAQGLTKRYGPHRALEGVSFEVRRGEVLGLLGPNGAGKSTTMKILTCFIAPSEGTARVNGFDIWEDPIGVRASIGYLPESTPLYAEMLVLEYLEFMAAMRGLRGDAAKTRIKKVVEETDLGDVIAKEIRTLSKGYRQRVGLAQALVHEPPILILDEPMSGLDPNQALEIRDLIKQIGKERTVILSTHNLAEVQVTCQRVLIISKGRIVADDTPEALSSRGRNRYLVVVEKESAGGDGKAAGVLSKIPGAETVRATSSSDPKGLTFEIVSASAVDLRAEIFRAAVAGGLVLLELRTRGENLEQVFRELTLGDASAKGEHGRDEEAARRPGAGDGEGEEDEDEDRVRKKEGDQQDAKGGR